MHKPTGHIVISPRITEKGAYLSAVGAYVFNVGVAANKREIAEAIHTLYKVAPRKVTVVNTPRKRVSTRGTNRKGQTAATKKAYVYLKQGDTIELS